MNVDYVEQVPALHRKRNCNLCGQMFFKHEPDQKLCSDCEGDNTLDSAANEKDNDQDWPEMHGAYQDKDGNWVV